MTLRFEYTVDDFIEAQQAHGKRMAGTSAPLMLVIVPVAAGLAVWLALTLLSRADARTGWISFASVILPWVVFLLALPLVARIQQRKLGPGVVAASTRALQGAMTAEVDAGGVAIWSPIWRVQYQWAAVIGFDETANLFLLYISPAASHALPKRGFAGPEEIDAFRNLAKRFTQPDAHPVPVTREQ